MAMFGHPRGLAVLYLTEVWERFSFYGLKALLVLYLNSGVLSPPRFSNVLGSGVLTAAFGQPSTRLGIQALSSQINELYSGAAYITPLAGGAIADRLLGARSALLLGGVLMAAGHGCMACERWFLCGLLLLVMGNGLFKPTVSSILSRLYDTPALLSLRDRGFAIFYTGINVGALLAPLVCGELQRSFGYDVGFGAAGVGMLLGLIVFVGGAHHIPSDSGGGGSCPPRALFEQEVHSSNDESTILVTKPPVNFPMMPVCARGASESKDCRDPCCVVSTPSFGASGAFSVSRTPRERTGRPRCHSLGSLSALCLLVVPFWVAHEQLSNTMPLFFRDHVERSVRGYELPAAWLQSLNPLFCICLMPCFTWLWGHQARRGAEPSPVRKMALGCLLQGCGWLTMAVGSLTTMHAVKVPLIAPLLATLLLTSGQLFLAPVGLALVSRSAPVNARSTAIGLWFLAGGVAGLLAGQVGILYSIWEEPSFFLLLSAMCFVDAALMAKVAPRLNRMPLARTTSS